MKHDLKVTVTETTNTSKRSIPSFNREDWASAYCNVEKELKDIPLKIIKGQVPKDLKGTFYRNGPGRLERGGRWVHHPFDGDGMIAAIKFKNGNVKITNKYVRTEGWIAEEKAKKFLYRGVFGTQKPGGAIANAFDIRLKNIANTHVVKLGNELLALWEASSPYALEPTTLETIGISNLNGALKPGEAFSAHPRFDPGHYGQKRMVTFGVKTGPKSTLRLMEFSAEGNHTGKLLSDRKDQFNGFAFLHDFAITPNWAIFMQNAINFNPIPFLLGQKGAGQCLKSKKGGQAKFWLIPRDSGCYAGEAPRIINAPDGFVFHHLNAWEESKKVTIESIFYQDFPSIEPDEDFRQINFELLPEGILKRSCIDIESNTSSVKIISNQCCEFATVNPDYEGIKAKYAWMAVSDKKEGNGPLQAIKKIDLINNTECIWSTAPRGFVSEPLFIAKKHNSASEDQGWIIVLIWDGKRKGTNLIILNSENLTEEAILELPIKIPHGLHGSWVEDIS